MKLSYLSIENYRRFEKFSIALDPDLTVIAARNGKGKTTIIEAIAAALGPFVGAFDFGLSEHIRRTDARFAVLENSYESDQIFPVIIEAEAQEPSLSWQRALRSAKGRTTTKEASPLAKWGKKLQADLRDGEEVILPVLRYYSSKRLFVSHKNKPSIRKTLLRESRSAGYEDCLSSLSSFSQLEDWFKLATNAVQQQQELPGYGKSNLASRLRGVANAVNTVMVDEEWGHFHFSYIFGELAMVHPEHGALPVSLLSDGVRAMMTMVADLAVRCARLNGFLGEKACLESSGIVLIDEVDLHLHPLWQQRVVQALQNAFPKMQFIITTHSPQVLSTIESKHVRIILENENGDWLAESPDEEIVGRESAIALSYVMGVNPVPPVLAAKIHDDYISHIENGSADSESGRSLRNKLIEIYGHGHPVLIRADQLIRFQQFKQRNSSQNGGKNDA